MSDAQEFKGTATEINRSNQKNTYKASNKVTVEGLFEENTTYYYSYQKDGQWTAPEKYTTDNGSKFSFIFVGDPQIGSSNPEKGTDSEQLQKSFIMHSLLQWQMMHLTGIQL